MKNRFWAVLVTILLFSLLAVSAVADTGVVNASSLNIRESASSKSDVIKVVKEGTKVEIKGTSGSWYKVSVGGKTGYAAKKYLTVSSGKNKSSAKNTSSSSSSESGKKQSSSDGTCKKGDKGDAVKKVQKRLKELGYLTASVDVRAERRYDELKLRGEEPDFEEIKKGIEQRDYQDMNRDIAPLKQAEDAVLIDSSDMTIAEVVDRIIELKNQVA